MNKHILCFGSHPDDIEFGCAGTILQMQKQGYSCTFAIYTSGEAGSKTIAPATLAATREQEAIAAAASLGVKDVRFFRFPDGLMRADDAMKIPVINLIRELRPEIVFTHSRYDSFSDHKVLSHLTLAAVDAAAGPWYQQSKGAPHHVSKIYGYEVWHPMSEHQLAVNISDFVDQKISSLQLHRSQIADINYDHAARGLAAYRGVTTHTGSYAEVFEVIRATL